MSMSETTPGRPEMLDATELENSKENILPLREGRSASKLRTALSLVSPPGSAGSNPTETSFNLTPGSDGAGGSAARHPFGSAESRKAIADDWESCRPSYEAAILSARGTSSVEEDPLAGSLAHIKYLRETDLSGTGASTELLNALEDAVQRHVDDERYASDDHYIKLWVMYANANPNPADVFAYMDDMKIGLESALAHEAYAIVLEAGLPNTMPKLMEILHRGIALPPPAVTDRLRARLDNLNAEQGLVSPAPNGSRAPPSSLQRATLSSLTTTAYVDRHNPRAGLFNARGNMPGNNTPGSAGRSGTFGSSVSGGTFGASASSGSTFGARPTQKPGGGGSFDIFVDDGGSSGSKPAPFLPTQPLAAQKENNGAPRAWNDPGLAPIGASGAADEAPAALKPKPEFEVYVEPTVAGLAAAESRGPEPIDRGVLSTSSKPEPRVFTRPSQDKKQDFHEAPTAATRGGVAGGDEAAVPGSYEEARVASMRATQAASRSSYRKIANNGPAADAYWAKWEKKIAKRAIRAAEAKGQAAVPKAHHVPAAVPTHQVPPPQDEAPTPQIIRRLTFTTPAPPDASPLLPGGQRHQASPTIGTAEAQNEVLGFWSGGLAGDDEFANLPLDGDETCTAVDPDKLIVPDKAAPLPGLLGGGLGGAQDNGPVSAGFEVFTDENAPMSKPAPAGGFDVFTDENAPVSKPAPAGGFDVFTDENASVPTARSRKEASNKDITFSGANAAKLADDYEPDENDTQDVNDFTLSAFTATNFDGVTGLSLRGVLADGMTGVLPPATPSATIVDSKTGLPSESVVVLGTAGSLPAGSAWDDNARETVLMADPMLASKVMTVSDGLPDPVALGSASPVPGKNFSNFKMPGGPWRLYSCGEDGSFVARGPLAKGGTHNRFVLRADSDLNVRWSHYLATTAANRATNPLTKASIATVDAVWAVPNGIGYLASLGGASIPPTLAEIVDLYDDSMPSHLALFYGIEVLRILESIHAVGVTHGDLQLCSFRVREPETRTELTRWQPNGAGGWGAYGLTVDGWGKEGRDFVALSGAGAGTSGERAAWSADMAAVASLLAALVRGEVCEGQALEVAVSALGASDKTQVWAGVLSALLEGVPAGQDHREHLTALIGLRDRLENALSTRAKEVQSALHMMAMKLHDK